MDPSFKCIIIAWTPISNLYKIGFWQRTVFAWFQVIKSEQWMYKCRSTSYNNHISWKQMAASDMTAEISNTSRPLQFQWQVNTNLSSRVNLFHWSHSPYREQLWFKTLISRSEIKADPASLVKISHHKTMYLKTKENFKVFGRAEGLLPLLCSRHPHRLDA